MIRRPPRSKRTSTPFPYPTPVRSRPRRSRGRGDRHQATLRGTAEGDLRMMAYALLFGFGCFALGLLLNFYRLAKGPSLADRILALDTMMINSIALQILYGISSASAAHFEGALLFAMVGFVSTVPYCRFIQIGQASCRERVLKYW